MNHCKRFQVCIVWIATCCIIGLVFGFGGILVPVPESSAATVKMVPESFTELAEKMIPSVVNIRTVKTIRGGGRVFRHFWGPFQKDDPMREFFEKFFGEEQRDFKQRSLGSGFIIDRQGYIVTNNHVIEGADQIKVILQDEKEYAAEVVGRDPNTDIALIKIKAAENLPVAQLGDSDTLKVGEWVMAIGNPFGLSHTVTAGIVSAKGRVIGSGPYDDFIQTDASINPGNSGGPLLNMKGEVVGINTAIVATGQGIGFAIPINLARGIIEQLKTSGEVTRGWLGVAIQDLSRELAEYYGLKNGKGVLVTEVFTGDPADRAGIKPQDIILEVNGKHVETTRDLTGLIASLRVGQIVDILVLRDRKKLTFKVKIAKREEEKISARRFPQKQEDELGIRAENITPEMARRFNLSETEGVVVSSVKPGSKGAEAGLMVGDVIKEINHISIKNVDDYKEAIAKIDKGETIQMFVKRGKVGFLVIKITK
ncbi:MAG: DegQ family serine endoprotease [Deltaproteobacteria bacterium]|nr:DegQ family serine endoprotease [Deltaproteobacteria bacterium]MBW1993167.1 DegQ family serine endoprotease [Deltaproteobacteria bacterium]MBW2151823.1 DegQ family serine endoprotease [Deltaproteobacteria bacterium]